MSLELLASLYNQMVLSPYFFFALLGVLLIIAIMKATINRLEKEKDFAYEKLYYERGKNSRIMEENRMITRAMHAMAEGRFTIFLADNDNEFYEEDDEDEDYDDTL